MVFLISDDGRGLDNARILLKARELGLIGAHDTPSEPEIQRLILRPGFSTAQQLSQVAGRGVGMDVVNSEIKQLGGHLLIESEYGAGSRFTLRLPFAMAANPVLFVEVQDQQYALPLGCVQGLARVDEAPPCSSISVVMICRWSLTRSIIRCIIWAWPWVRNGV
ncbi:MAG: ATP-binding protein [Thiolinea sp.]